MDLHRPHDIDRYDESLLDPGAGDERPPWIEEATDPTWWDVAFGSYGDGYLEWVNDHYYWEHGDERTIADTRSLWHHRGRYLSDPHLDELLAG